MTLDDVKKEVQDEIREERIEELKNRIKTRTRDVDELLQRVANHKALTAADYLEIENLLP